tara:strand:+ start:586 stop:1176 length:591 start_codon:yes stop_codon:yes gene_type:complete
MKYISYFLFSILLISCGKSSDIDKNLTFLERFDGVGFKELEDERGVFYFFSNDLNAFRTSVYPESSCKKCITWSEGDNIDICEKGTSVSEIRLSLTITENTYDRLVLNLKDYEYISGNTDQDLEDEDYLLEDDADGVAYVQIPEGIHLIYEAIDDDNILSKLTPYTERWNGSLDTIETTYTRVEIEFSSINCNEIQ